MELKTRLDKLQNTLQRALQELPGACALYLVGSLASGTGDQYSDIDLQVLTSDLPASVAAGHAILEQVDPLDLELPIMRTSDRWASTFLFRNESCFHKLDLGFTVSSSVEHVSPGLAGDAVMLWEQVSQGSRSPIGISTFSQPHVYVPALETVEHFIIGQLIGGVRYVKARKRGQSYTSWRFASAMANGLATLRLQQKTKWTARSSSLNTWEYVGLDRISSPAESETFLAALDFSTQHAMDSGVDKLLRQIVEAAESSPAFSGSVAGVTVMHRLLDFIRVELAAL